jgi:MoaA/NifB/PqqE/SkfB family radical SAM enzyme
MTTKFLWLELTGKCQLSCVHCYADSGPDGSHGTMTERDWVRIIDEAARLGVEMVQFIGGEPTLHPDLPRLIAHSVNRGIKVEVFSNLVHVSDELWEALSRTGVSLATSWYADTPERHRRITGRDTFARTKANIVKALERSIPVRAGIIAITADQGIEEARRTLSELGVQEIGVDEVRRLGRGRRPDAGELCGHCGDGIAAIGPTGEVWPCPLSRWVTAGNVRGDPENLSGILDNKLRPLAAELVSSGTVRDTCQPKCVPDSYCNPTCTPGACKPRTREMHE